MKRHVLLITGVVALLAFSSCNQKKLAQLESQNDELLRQNQMQDSMLTEFMTAFDQFEDNLSLIRERENLIEVNASDPEFRVSNKERITDGLEQINLLMEENRAIIDDLNGKVKNLGVKNRQLRNSIAKLTEKMEVKDQEILAMTNQLAAQEIVIDSLYTANSQLAVAKDELTMRSVELGTQVDEQASRLQAQEDELTAKTYALNTAYYVAGNKKELKQLNVLDGKRVDSRLANDSFNRIDITQVDRIPVEAKKVKLLTSHPEGSYKFVKASKEETNLEIVNPDEFWRTSKYLVLLTD
ncbi:MAG: hypothetical protein AAF824_15725 [Bacteroidota bacterium]